MLKYVDFIFFKLEWYLVIDWLLIIHLFGLKNMACSDLNRKYNLTIFEVGFASFKGIHLICQQIMPVAIYNQKYIPWFLKLGQ